MLLSRTAYDMNHRISSIWIGDGSDFRQVSNHEEILAMTDSAIFVGTRLEYGIGSWEAIDYEGNLIGQIPTGYPDPGFGYIVVGVVNDRLVFTAPSSTQNTDAFLWSSDGTDAIVLRELDNNFRVAGSGEAYQGELFFPADTTHPYSENGAPATFTAFGVELHKTDGIENTSMIFDFHSGESSFDPHNFMTANDELYFVGTMEEGDTRIFRWFSEDISTSMDAVSNFRVVNVEGDYLLVNDQVYFIGNDGVHGRELWLSQLGMREETHRLTDINPSGDSFGYVLTLLPNGDDIYFSTEDSEGAEQWWIIPSSSQTAEISVETPSVPLTVTLNRIEVDMPKRSILWIVFSLLAAGTLTFHQQKG